MQKNVLRRKSVAQHCSCKRNKIFLKAVFGDK
jgi:hypothetical protein